MGAKTPANMPVRVLVPNEAGGKHRHYFLPSRPETRLGGKLTRR